MQHTKAMVDGIMEVETADSGAPSVHSIIPLSFTLDTKGVRDFFWQWVLPVVLMFAVLWVVMWALQGKTDEAASGVPSLVNTANACTRLICNSAICNLPVEVLGEMPEAFVGEWEVSTQELVEEICPVIAETSEVSDDTSETPNASSPSQRPRNRLFFRNRF
jgi:hypothetical protein